MRAVRPAFTVIELVVVVAIVGVLMALLVPAVQKARETALRTECANNLRQIGTACHHYHEANECFPPGYQATAAYPATSPGWGWASFLVPYLEQDNLYRQIDFTLPVEHPHNAAAIATSVPVFLCP